MAGGAPQGPLFYELATRQWIDAFKGWDAALGKLARATRRMLDGSSDAAPLEPPVPRASSLPGSRTVVSEEDLEAARLAMTRFVGPIAKFIVSKAANTAQSLEDFHARLICRLTSGAIALPGCGRRSAPPKSNAEEDRIC